MVGSGERLLTVVAVTRGGYGRIWQFETLLESQTHPLIQYGDPVLSDAEDLLDEYRVLELPALLRLLGDEDLRVSLVDRISGLEAAGRTSRQVADALRVEHAHTDVWNALLRAAQSPPDSAARVLELVRSDREWDLDNRRKRTTMAEAAAKKEKAPKAEKVVKDKTVAGYPYTVKLDFGVGKDAEGKEAPYHPEKNNPKRGGAAERFKKYTKGITISDAIAAGMSAGNVGHDIEKGYVVVRAK